MKNFVAGILLVFSGSLIIGQELPLGYISYYSNDFTRPDRNGDLLFSSNAISTLQRGILKLNQQNDSVQCFNPEAVMLIDNNIFGDFIEEAKLKVSGSDSTQSGIYVIAGLRDSLNYYLVKFNNSGADFIRVYNGLDSILTTKPGFVLPQDKWLNIKITRDILTRKISIKHNGSMVEFVDPNLVMGYIGLGVQNATVEIDKLDVWAPTSIDKPAPLFREENRVE